MTKLAGVLPSSGKRKGPPGPSGTLIRCGVLRPLSGRVSSTWPWYPSSSWIRCSPLSAVDKVTRMRSPGCAVSWLVCTVSQAGPACPVCASVTRISRCAMTGIPRLSVAVSMMRYQPALIAFRGRRTSERPSRSESTERNRTGPVAQVSGCASRAYSSKGKYLI